MNPAVTAPNHTPMAIQRCTDRSAAAGDGGALVGAGGSQDLREVPCPSPDVHDNVVPFPTSAEQRWIALEQRLVRLLEDDDRAQGQGPHLVIARSAVETRYIGPFATQAAAMEVAVRERREWEAEFSAAAVSFDVAPLTKADELSSAGDLA